MSLSIIDCFLLLFLVIFLIITYHYDNNLGNLSICIIYMLLYMYEGKYIYIIASLILLAVIILAQKFYIKYYIKNNLVIKN